MVMRRVEGILFTDEEQQLIKQACELWDEKHELIDLRNSSRLKLPDTLIHKLRALDCAVAGDSRWVVLNEKTLRIREELSQPIDYWEWLIKWFRTRPWAIPVGAVVIGLPILWQYVEWIGKLIEFLQTRF